MSHKAPSINLYFYDNAEGHILMHVIKIRVNASQAHTHYCAPQWNPGQEGDGYCGIQDSPYGHDIIFSLWDSPSTHSPITAKYTGHGTGSSRFGGEGNGLRTIKYSYDWIQDRWYTLVVRNWNYGNHIRFGFWIHDQAARKWFHHATIDYPAKSGHKKQVTIHLDSTPPQPSVAPISFSITSATHNHASWSVPASSTPQFSYNVKIDGQSVAYGYYSEVRSVTFNFPEGSSIEVVLEDILGRQVSHTHYKSRL